MIINFIYSILSEMSFELCSPW